LIDLANPDGLTRSRLVEPKLVGMQTRLSSLKLAIVALDERIDLQPADNQMVRLFDAMTGGEFKSPKRLPDPDRAQEAQAVSAQLTGELRTAVARRSRKWL